MSRLRERKKIKTQQAILQSAKRLFVSRGYAKTAMSDIAADCEVGVGTLYNYYKSKSELLIEIFRMDLPDLSEQVETIMRNDRLRLRDKLHRAVSLFMEVFHQFPRAFYRDLAAILSNQSEGDILGGMLELDRQSMSLLSEILEQGKRTGGLPEAYPVNTSVSLMYSAVVTQIMLYIFDHRVTKEQIRDTLLEQMDFLLKLRAD